ncbi:hypothetical protein RHMOL_Rhmol06G0170800 [Rhododendron molle]|uniref:Uncharacterized protein n=1 Tax=Rhododendron molle TaxID=49168 RepID=A0ACC0NEU0_RHOML|nr:hypothetical protein RHMOL_Rhmol06G0170800 [Rhododendron molle]
MARPSLWLIIPLDIIITIFIFSVHLNNAQSVKYHPAAEANLSTTWINNSPTIYINSTDVFGGFKMTPVLSLSNTSQFVSGFYCFSNQSSCFFGIVIFAGRYDFEDGTSVNAPQLVWSANWDRPVKTNAKLKFTGNGDLILEDADGDMSFDHPTDSLLIGQKLVSRQKLIARTSSSDFSQGLFWLSIRYGLLSGYFEANPRLVYYETILEGIFNYKDSEEYVAFKNGSFNGQSIPLGSTTQFMRLEPDGHLIVYEWGGAEWNTMADLLTSGIGECGYPMACGKYGICSWNGQCGCLEGSNNETRNFKQINYKQPNLGCSLVTPITCNDSQYHSLLELKNTSYCNLNSRYNTEVNEILQLEDCKNACLRNCSCKAALFVYEIFDSTPRRGCLLLFDVFSLINNEGGYNNVSVFLKLQNFPRKKSRHGTIVLGSSLGALFGVFLLVGSCILVFKRKRELEELDDEFSVDKVPGMPTRFSYTDLKTATNDFNNKLGKGGFGSVFQGTLSDGTEVAVKHLDGLSQIKKSFLAEVETIGNIHHVNLVRLIGFCSEKSHRLLVYEYMPNGSLDRWIFRQEHTLWVESRKKIILDVAKGLAYLHEECRQKIYHLDIKPQNILLDDHFNAKISDFGLSKLIDEDRSQVVTTLRGTPGYLAP